MTRPITGIAVVLILLGVVTMAGPTFGFATIAADRGVNVATADDSSAYLGLEDQSASASIDSPGEQTVVYTVTDNVRDDSATVDASIVGITDDSNDPVTSAALSVNVQPGSDAETFDIVLACEDGASIDGSYRVLLRFVASSDASSVDATRETTALVPVDCTAEPVVVSVDEDGDVTSGGDVTVDNNVNVGGDIESGGSVTVDNNVNVGGDIESGGSVTIANNANVGGNIVAQGDITIRNNAVSGDLIAGGNVDIRNNAKIDGDVMACGTVTVRNNAVVTGTISENQTDLPGVQC
ncbi:polymer-forming protein [Natrinema hispanicum]|uniref:Polymer-forming protein n=1 Tax=Natrinema hispanicum TaxID=392421 RepID=A0A482YFW4_9EURY|nr:polymer-forming cytoskeletal protein [Natrinema hispanicum]RZV11711.1 polymer-forming protein [Natrinema hispanicum]